MAAGSTTLGDVSVLGPGNMWGQYDQNTGRLQVDAGDLEASRRALSSFANSGVPSFGNQLPAGVSQAAGQLGLARNSMADMQLGGLDAITGRVGTAFEQASQGLSQANQGFQTGLQNTAFTGAGNQLSSLNQTYDQVYGNTLGNLRSQAQVTNDRNFANLNQNLFSTGRMGTSGGALQTEAFAKGLASADAGFQLQAQQQAQMAQQNQLGLAQGLTGIGSGLAGQQNSLLNDAFSRFGQTASMASDLNNQRFQRSMYANDQAYSRAQEGLGTQMQLAGLPAQLQNAQLGNVLAALQGQSGLQSQALELYNAGLQTNAASANARVGAGSNMAAIVGSPSFGAGAAQNAAMWGQLGSTLINNSGNISNAFGRWFGGTQQPTVQTGTPSTSSGWSGPRE